MYFNNNNHHHHNNNNNNNNTESDTKAQKRIFSKIIKDSCWRNAKLVPGRSGDRWRYDSYGNIVCKALKGCNGCLCHEYDHIIPHSKGGLSILDNCQILQTTINRRKGALLQDGEYIYMSHGCHKQYNDRELDIIELALYGDIANNSSSSKPKCTALRQFELVTKKSHCKEY